LGAEFPRQPFLRTAPYGEFRDYQLEMDCGNPGCRRGRRYAMADLAGVHGKGMLVSQVIRRLRCQECDGKAVSVALLRPVGVRKAGADPHAAGGA
jgi:hypothetical protein